MSAKADLIRLCYASKASFTSRSNQGVIEPSVARILMQSRKNNPRHRIGGVLHYANGYFFQCLEGNTTEVDSTFARIGQDPRHHSVQVLSRGHIDQRLFGDWSMKYLAVEDRLRAVLHRHSHSSFNPFEFDQALIQELLLACVGGVDPTEPTRSGSSEKPGWLQRASRILRRH